jgi:hypothetical protein
METSSQTKPGRKHPFRLFSWRMVRRSLIVITALITLLAVAITEENWRGKKALADYKRGWEARGERFDLEAFIPPLVPEAQNYFTARFVAETLHGIPKTNAALASAVDIGEQAAFTIYRGDAKLWPTNDGSWQLARMTDLRSWQQYFRALADADITNALPIPPQLQQPATDVLFALIPFKVAIQELREASLRPDARQPLHYENGLEVVRESLPYLASLKGCGQILQLRAIAELNSGKSEEALQDIKLMLRMAESVHDQPLLISHLVRLGILGLVFQPVYEGLVQHQWSEVQLADLERELAKLDLLSDYHRVIRGERAFAIDSLERQRITREYKWLDESSGIPKVETVNFRFTPSAFFYQNELTFAKLSEQFLLPLVDLEHRIVSPTAVRKADAKATEQMKHYSPYRILALMTLQDISKSVFRFTMSQNAVDLARVACALERYRLAHDGYPEALDALSPTFMKKLPHDVINGQPLKYRGTKAGRFLLYSVGWNEIDDDGIAESKKSRVDPEKGDWVWQIPPFDSQKAAKETKE